MPINSFSVSAIQMDDFELTILMGDYPVGARDGAMMCIDVPIIDNDMIESNETFIVTLIVTPGSPVAVGNTETTVTIVDDDSELCAVKLVGSGAGIHTMVAKTA